jgi:hypothetical protein
LVWFCSSCNGDWCSWGETVLQVKGNKGLYPKDFIEVNLKDALGGVSVVLTGIAPNGVWLIAVGYRYSVKTTLFFVLTENAKHDEIYRFLW